MNRERSNMDTVGIVIVSKKTRRFLLLHRVGWPIVWSVLSGTMDKQYESPLHTIKREVKEEIGIHPGFIQNITKVGVIGETRKFHLFVGFVNDEFKPNLDLTENDDWGWFDMDSLPHPIHKHWSETYNMVEPFINLRESINSDINNLLKESEEEEGDGLGWIRDTYSPYHEGTKYQTPNGNILTITGNDENNIYWDCLELNTNKVIKVHCGIPYFTNLIDNGIWVRVGTPNELNESDNDDLKWIDDIRPDFTQYLNDTVFKDSEFKIVRAFYSGEPGYKITIEDGSYMFFIHKKDLSITDFNYLVNLANYEWKECIKLNGEDCDETYMYEELYLLLANFKNKLLKESEEEEDDGLDWIRDIKPERPIRLEELELGDSVRIEYINREYFSDVMKHCNPDFTITNVDDWVRNHVYCKITAHDTFRLHNIDCGYDHVNRYRNVYCVRLEFPNRTDFWITSEMLWLFKQN